MAENPAAAPAFGRTSHAETVRVVVEGSWLNSRDIIGYVVADVRVKDRTVVVVLAPAEKS